MFFNNKEYILPLLFHSFFCIHMEKINELKKYFHVFHGQAHRNLLEILLRIMPNNQ